MAQAIRQLAGNGAQSLSLMSALSCGYGDAGGNERVRAERRCLRLRAIRISAGESVAISGQAGAVSPLAGVDVDRIRDAIETFARRTGRRDRAELARAE